MDMLYLAAVEEVAGTQGKRPNEESPMNSVARTALLLVATLLLQACDPDDVPRFSGDGKTVAFLRNANLDPKKDQVPLGLIDVASGKARTFLLPERYSAGGIAWVGARLLVSSTRPNGKVDEKGKPLYDFADWLVNPATGKIEPATFKTTLFARPFHGTYKGARCLYNPELTPDQVRILSLPGLEEQAVFPVDVEPAGDGWMMATEEKETRGGLTKDMVAVRILNPEGKEVCRIPRDEIAKASYRQARSPTCARVSEDHRRVALGFDTSTIFRQMDAEYTFGVYDMGNGKLLFSGESNSLRGLPVMRGETLYVLEAKSRKIYVGDRTAASLLSAGPPRSQPTSEVVLASHTKKGRQVVLELSLGKKSRATRYSASEDRKRFVLQVEGPSPRLLIIPIADAVSTDQVKTLPIK